jgi:DNA-binding transcriptional regulator YiaG
MNQLTAKEKTETGGEKSAQNVDKGFTEWDIIILQFHLAVILTNAGNRSDSASSPLSGCSVAPVYLNNPAAPGDPLETLYVVYPAELVCAPPIVAKAFPIRTARSVAIYGRPSLVAHASGVIDSLAIARGVAAAEIDITMPMERAIAAAEIDIVVGTEPAVTRSALETSVAASMVSEIRSSLSLNISELARVLAVERATIYGWIKGGVALPRGQDKQDRLRAVYAVAREWSTLHRRPMGAWRHLPINGERTFLDLLHAISRDVETSPAALSAALETLSSMQEAARFKRDTSLTALRASISRRRKAGAPGSDKTGEDDASGSDADAIDRVIDNLDWYQG